MSPARADRPATSVAERDSSRNPVPAAASAASPVPLPGTEDDGLVTTARTPVPKRRSGRRGVRGRRQSRLGGIRIEVGPGWRLGLGALGIVLVAAAWSFAASRMDTASILPSPAATFRALVKLGSDGILTHDLWASTVRILIGYSISVALGIVFGLAIGSFTSVEGFFEPQIGFLRYIPASALTPLLLLWFGIGENPKILLIVVGTVFFNILMMADVARNVPRELVNAAYTLGAGRWTVMRRVIFRHSVPGIIDAARVNLAAAWLMLVVAELLAAQEGLAYQIVRAQRFRAVDTIFALLIVFGLIGLFSDAALRLLRWVVAPWARS
jgi:NitT/TauT family transport system permease protein